MKEFIIAYDICDEKRLRKIAKYLERRAMRIQFSLYFISNCSKSTLMQMMKKIKEIIDIENDDVRVYEIDVLKSIYINKEDDLKYLVL